LTKGVNRIRGYGYSFSPEEVQWVQERLAVLLTTGAHLTMGRYGEELEHEVAALTSAKYAVAVASGTAALEVILRAVDVAGSEVIVPTNTFGATAVAALRAGATVVLADVGDDLALDVANVVCRITPSTRAVIAVHIGGRIADSIPHLVQICGRHGIALVEDCAHALGATQLGSPAGTFGVAGAFSLFATKVLTSGEGGLVVTSDPSIAATARLLRDHAKRPDGTMAVTGYNWRLSEAQALLALAQVRAFPRLHAARQAVLEVYQARLPGLDAVRTLAPRPHSIHNGYKYPIFTQSHDLETLTGLLSCDYGIDLGGTVYRTPLHEQPAFQSCTRGEYPGAAAWCPAHFCPPSHPGMTGTDAHRVADALASALPQVRKQVQDE
jgi:dTDP-4-amino-4,6-dideoxygalactose transaminase